jgi:hypothetical protein
MPRYFLPSSAKGGLHAAAHGSRDDIADRPDGDRPEPVAERRSTP